MTTDSPRTRQRRHPWLTTVLAALWALSPSLPAAEGSDDDKYRKAIDGAVDGGLEYLAHAQLPDGSFPGMPRCNAVASLCVMAFLAHGYLPGLEPYGATLNRGIDHILGSQGQDGTLIGAGGGAMYSHNIATLMLSEVSGMVDPERQKRIDEVLPRALQVILAAQKVTKPESQQGGWRYSANDASSDLSHSGWAIMALRSARNNNTPIPREAIDDGVKFVKRCAMPDGGFAYQPGGGSGLARSGAALLCLELSGQHRDAMTLRAGRFITNRFKQGWGGESFYYGMYYCSQGMFQLGEEEWAEFAPLMYETILRYQAADGAWQSVPGGANEDGPGPCYRTAMAILALSVNYRQLPIYQR